MELSAETRFSSKIMSPNLALASVTGLSAGVNDRTVAAENNGTGAGAPGVGGCAEREATTARAIEEWNATRFICFPFGESYQNANPADVTVL